MKTNRNVKFFISILSIATAFLTVIFLMLPAIAIDLEEAEKEPGIEIDQTEETNRDTIQSDEVQNNDTDTIIEKTETEIVQETETDIIEKEYPAMVFNETVSDFIVYIEVPEDSLPSGTTVKINEVELEDDQIKTIEDSLSNNKKVASLKALDITFFDGDKEIEPIIPVKVTISSSFIEENDKDALIIHIDDKGNTDLVEAAKTDEDTLEIINNENSESINDQTNNINEANVDSSLSFNAESFSVYAVVYTLDTQIEAGGETYNIILSYDESAGIPDGSVLKVREIEQGTVEYDKYLYDSALALNKDIDDIAYARFFDIEIFKDDQLIEPESPVNVSITYADKYEMYDGQEFDLVHFKNQDEIEIIENVDAESDLTSINYVQNSFSVTGTIVSNPARPVINTANKYAIITKYNNEFYAVALDGTLQKISNDSLTFDTQGNPLTAILDRGMMWTYYAEKDSSDVTRYYIRHSNDSWDYEENQLVKESGVLYSYIDPTSNLGISNDTGDKQVTCDEDGKPIAWRIVNYVSGKNSEAMIDHMKHIGNKYASSSEEAAKTSYLGVSSVDGTLRVVGNVASKDDPRLAEFYLATFNSVPDVSPQNHTVNHIDISIVGKARLNYPLIPGMFFDQDGYPVNDRKTIQLEKNVDVTVDDIKNAELFTFVKNNNNQIIPINDAFYITGYTGNAANDISTPQVRIEGSFKVANLAPYTKWFNNTEESNYNRSNIENDLMNNSNFTAIRNNRLNNRIYYTVSTTKDVTFELKDGNKTLYHKNETGELVAATVTVPVTLSSTFDYWDDHNECPPVKLFNDQDRWADGLIIGDGGRMSSGMDFALGGSQSAEVNEGTIDISKFVIDSNGNLIKVKDPITNKFEIYERVYSDDAHDADDLLLYKDAGSTSHNHDYTCLRNYGKEDTFNKYENYTLTDTKEVIVGQDGMGINYDYGRTPGMVYIKEQPDSIKEIITDINGKKWYYQKTYMETEYVRRWDKTINYSLPNHVTKDYTNKTSDSYKSIPEAVGSYKYKAHSNDTTYISDSNAVLDFYVYNIYQPLEYQVKLLKVDQNNNEKKLSDAEFDLYELVASGETKIGSYKTVDGYVNLSDLKSGSKYKLVETKAPAGYCSINEPIFIFVDDPLAETTDEKPISYMIGTESELIRAEKDSSDNRMIIKIENMPGAELPMTGGTGSRIYRYTGIIIALSAMIIVLYIRRKELFSQK